MPCIIAYTPAAECRELGVHEAPDSIEGRVYLLPGGVVRVVVAFGMTNLYLVKGPAGWLLMMDYRPAMVCWAATLADLVEDAAATTTVEAYGVRYELPSVVHGLARLLDHLLRYMAWSGRLGCLVDEVYRALEALSAWVVAERG